MNFNNLNLTLNFSFHLKCNIKLELKGEERELKEIDDTIKMPTIYFFFRLKFILTT
jgi:hypothetical protein